MNKQELVKAVAAAAKISQKAAGDAIDAFTTAVVKAVKKGDTVTLVGFGSFKRIDRKAREGRNPQTGKAMKIPAKKSPKFTPGKGFKDAIK